MTTTQLVFCTFVNFICLAAQLMVFYYNRKLLKRINEATTRQRREFSQNFDAMCKLVFNHDKD